MKVLSTLIFLHVFLFASQTATASLGVASPETFALQTATASLGAASPETFALQTATASLGVASPETFALQTATASLGAASPETFAPQTATASLGAASPETFAPQTATASFPKEQLSPGGIVKLYFHERPDIYINNKKKEVFTKKLDNKWLVLLPLSLYKAPQTLRIVSQTSYLVQVHLISMEPSTYPEQHIRVKNREFVTASKKTLKRIKRESDLKKEKLSSHTRSYVQDLKMIKPLESELRHDYGRRRFFNGIPKNPHAGIDLSGKEGDKIKAPMSGTVIILGDLFYNGKMMMIDHGQGLISAYSHLSKIYMKEGTWVNQGAYIAEVGSSGRATGPHLHWSVYLGGEPVNPDLFLDFGKAPSLEVGDKTKCNGKDGNNSH